MEELTATVILNKEEFSVYAGQRLDLDVLLKLRNKQKKKNDLAKSTKAEGPAKISSKGAMHIIAKEAKKAQKAEKVAKVEQESQ